MPRDRFIAAIWTVLLFAAAALAQGPPAYEPQYGKSGVDLGAMDTSVSPCTNFYQYACGGWRAKNPISADQSRWARVSELGERNLKIEREILEKASPPSPNRTAIEQRIGDFYAACIDEAGIERRGVEPIRPALDGINALRSKDQLAAELGRLNLIGADSLFAFYAYADIKDSTTNIAYIDQGGITLPDRDYYLKTDQRSVDIRKKYEQHIVNMFELLRKSLNTPGESNAKAEAVLKFETALAEASMDRIQRRNPELLNHPMTKKDLPDLTPNFEWNAYFSIQNTPSFTKIIVGNPDFFKKLTGAIEQTSLDDIKTYLTWRLLLKSARAMPRAFLDESFQFFGQTLSGQKELSSRSKRCVRATDRALGELLGQKFVEVAFGGPAKAKALELIGEIKKSMRVDIETATWMSETTKQQAYSKLGAVTEKIGYPEKWRDYSSVVIKPDDYLADEQQAAEFEVHRNLNQIGKPVDKTEWGMTPPTVNANYNSSANNINFPAGILQPPFYNPAASEAVNLGAIGAVVGHELTHGFDDQGRKFDGAGNLRDWWTPEDSKNFEARAECVVDEYNGFSPVEGVKLKGKLTLGENAADNGGLYLAYMALMRDLADKTIPETKQDGFTPQQQFFLGFGQIWCENATEASIRVSAATNSHSPGLFRTNGVVQNMKEFQQAFGCKAQDPMVSAKACRVW
jgi:endothelin-converting enzyme/putative endopeptidase